MKAKVALLSFLFITSFAISQVGIGTVTPSSSSILDIHVQDKGILLPRVDLGDINTAAPVVNPEKSLLVWNTDAANGGVDEGFYFWNGTAWSRLSTAQNEIKRYAEIYKATPGTTLNAATPIAFGTTSFEEGITANNNNFQVSVAGVYRVSYTVTIERGSGSGGGGGTGGDITPRFYLSINQNTTVLGSSTFATINNSETFTVSMTKFVQLNAGQQLYLLTDTTAANILVQPRGTTFNIELVKAD